MRINLFDSKRRRRREKDSNINILIQHTDYVYGFAFRYCGNENVANDLVQETFLIAYKKFEQLRDITKCKFWLVSILRNVFYRECEKSKKHSNYSDIDSLEEKISDNYESCEKILMNDDLLQKVLNKIEEKYKTPLLMYFLNELSYKEIAEELVVPIGTVMSRISRAKSFLRKELVKLDEEKKEYSSNKNKSNGHKTRNNIIEINREVI